MPPRHGPSAWGPRPARHLVAGRARDATETECHQDRRARLARPRPLAPLGSPLTRLSYAVLCPGGPGRCSVNIANAPLIAWGSNDRMSPVGLEALRSRGKAILSGNTPAYAAGKWIFVSVKLVLDRLAFATRHRHAQYVICSKRQLRQISADGYHS